MLRIVGENPSASDVAVLLLHNMITITVFTNLINMIITIDIMILVQEMAIEVDIGQTGSFIFPNFLKLIQRSTMPTKYINSVAK